MRAENFSFYQTHFSYELSIHFDYVACILRKLCRNCSYLRWGYEYERLWMTFFVSQKGDGCLALLFKRCWSYIFASVVYILFYVFMLMKILIYGNSFKPLDKEQVLSKYNLCNLFIYGYFCSEIVAKHFKLLKKKQVLSKMWFVAIPMDSFSSEIIPFWICLDFKIIYVNVLNNSIDLYLDLQNCVQLQITFYFEF